jgi:hypothetical protein
LYGLDTLSCHAFGFTGVVALRIGSSALCIGGGPAFGRSTFGGSQRDPSHGDPVAFLHELGLRKHTAVTRPQHAPVSEALSAQHQINTVTSSLVGIE